MSAPSLNIPVEGLASPVPAPRRAAPDADAEKTYKGAIQLLQKGRLYERVIRSMDPLLGRYPEESRFWEASGVARVALALEVAAEALPDAAVPNRRPDPLRRVPPGELFEGGVEQIETAIKLQPNVPEYYQSLGWAHLANTRLGLNENVLQSREEARRAFEGALRLLPNEFTYWQALADYHRLLPGPRTSASFPPPPQERVNPGGDPLSEPLSGMPPATPPDETPSESATEARAGGIEEPPPPLREPPPPLTETEAPYGLRIYERLSAARPRDAGLHFVLYEQHLKHGREEDALRELQLAEQADPANALYPYLLAYHRFGGDEESGLAQADPSQDEEESGLEALQAVQRAQYASSFDPSPYRPAYPPFLAPALRVALGDSLTPETLKLYDRLAALAQRLQVLGSRWLDAGFPADAEELYYNALFLGERLVNSAMSARDRYLLHLPELSAGLKIQEGALNQLRSLYHRYALADRLPWLQQKQLDLDSLRQILSRATE